MADDGGGSGMLRQDLGMPPPGDIRHCMEALANTEPLMRELLHYRFTEGCLAGQSFGNLFLAALNGISGSFDAAVSRMSEVLAITGRVLPVTTADVQLVAEFENGASVRGGVQDLLLQEAGGLPHPPGASDPLPAQGPAGGGLRHRRRGHDRPGARQPVYQHHSQPSGGGHRGGDSGL